MEDFRKQLDNFRVNGKRLQHYHDRFLSDKAMAELEELYDVNVAGITAMVNNLEDLQKKNSEFWNSRHWYYKQRNTRHTWMETWLENTRQSADAVLKECIELQTANISYCETCKTKATSGWRRGLDGLPVCERCCLLSFRFEEFYSRSMALCQPSTNSGSKVDSQMVTNSTNPPLQCKAYTSSASTNSQGVSSEKLETPRGPPQTPELESSVKSKRHHQQQNEGLVPPAEDPPEVIPQPEFNTSDVIPPQFDTPGVIPPQCNTLVVIPPLSKAPEVILPQFNIPGVIGSQFNTPGTTCEQQETPQVGINLPNSELSSVWPTFINNTGLDDSELRTLIALSLRDSEQEILDLKMQIKNGKIEEGFRRLAELHSELYKQE